ncbi:MAG: prohibitin family protein [Bacteroidales bacterium]|jgi:regulator of protease activity HflC (stomatin/prohibitin superfamily)|nr:prohibitin family protein [Bacteroidales bacterium]
MTLITLGLIIIIVALIATRTVPYIREHRSGIIAGAIIIFFVLLSFASIVQVEPGMVGVKKLFGKVSNNILESGLNFINPLAKVVMFDIRTENYTMSGVHDEGTVQADDAIRVLSADGLEVIVDLTVLYKVIPAEAPRILREIGTDYRNVLVRPICRTGIRDNAVYYDAVSLYSTKREEFQDRIFSAIESNFRDRGLMLEQLLVRNLTLPESVKAAIESKINAEQEAQKMTFVLQKERQEAERKRVEAQGIADYQKILTSTITDKLLQYEMIKAISSSPNSKLIIMTNEKGLPIMVDTK